MLRVCVCVVGVFACVNNAQWSHNARQKRPTHSTKHHYHRLIADQRSAHANVLYTSDDVFVYVIYVCVCVDVFLCVRVCVSDAVWLLCTNVLWFNF